MRKYYLCQGVTYENILLMRRNDKTTDTYKLICHLRVPRVCAYSGSLFFHLLFLQGFEILLHLRQLIYKDFSVALNVLTNREGGEAFERLVYGPATEKKKTHGRLLATQI